MSFHYKNNVLHVESVALPALAEAHATPSYIYSAALMRHNYQQLSTALEGVNICFAIKSCSNIAIIKLFGTLGAGADIVSGGELKRALAAGIAPHKIVFSGVGKTAEEIRLALYTGIHQLNVESMPELVEINRIAAELGCQAPIALRVNPDVAADTHDKIATGRKGDKFGIDHEQIAEATALIRTLTHLELKGLAVHIGSQLFDIDIFRRAFTVTANYVKELQAQGFALTRLDLGGGMGVPYKGETVFDCAAYARMVQETVGHLGLELTIEPGRFLVANSAVLLSRVTYVKEGAANRFIICDSAMNDLMRPALYESYHGIRAVEQAQTEVKNTDVTVVGPICESSDCFAETRELPPLKAGDLMVFDTAGAYGASMSNTYNTRALVPEILVDGDKVAVIRPRIEADAQIAWDAIPNWL